MANYIVTSARLAGFKPGDIVTDSDLHGSSIEALIEAVIYPRRPSKNLLKLKTQTKRNKSWRVYLSNPVVTVNSVDLQDQCTSATVNYVLEQLETTRLVTRHASLVAQQSHRCKTTALKLSCTKVRMRQKQRPRSTVWLASQQTSWLHRHQVSHQQQIRFTR
jgi:NMD protein affecting ribosome stability and mRNA decay